MKLIRGIRSALWLARLFYRFVSGRSMSGERKTDATFWRPARHSLDPSGTALRWEMMRGAARAAWRIGGLYLLLLAAIVLPISFLLGELLPWYLSFSFLLWGHLLTFGGAIGGWALRRMAISRGYYLPTLSRTEEEKLRIALRRIDGMRDWRREKVLPVAKVLSTITTTHIPERKASEWVTIPKDYREGGTVQLRLPDRFTGVDEGVKKRLVSSVSAKLGVPGMLPSWALEGSSPSLHLTAPPMPPDSLTYSDVKQWILHSEEYRPFLGLAGGDDPFFAEMVADSPHIGLSAGSGAGKSTMAKAIIAQVLRWGWAVVVIDWKQTEAYSWLGGLEGVTYLTEIEAIHDFGERVAEEVDIRKRNGMAGRAKVLVVRDEWNVTADLLMGYWQDLRSTAEPAEKRTMPVKSPALRGYATLDYAGREYGMFDFVIAQRFSARVFNGNSDIREVFQIKLLARYSAQTVKMLAPDIKPFPRKNNTPGRWVAVVADSATVIQAPFLTNDEARQVAAGGLPNPPSPFSTTQPTQRVRTHITQGDELGLDPTVPDDVSSLVNLPKGRKLSDLEDTVSHLNVSLNVLRTASKKDETFPSVIGGDPIRGYTYDPAEVLEWARRRHAAKKAEKSRK